jgi:nucleoid DNA-binding protein
VKVSAIGKQDVVEYMANKLNIPKIKANETLNVLLDLIKEEASKQIISSLL